MAKTPKRRKPADENGNAAAAAAPETPPENGDMKSPPASRLRSRKRTRRSSADDCSVASTTDDDEPAAKRRSTRRRRKTAEEEDESMAASSTDNDEQSTSSRRQKSTTTRRTRRKRTSQSDEDESMTEDSEDDAAKKPRASQNGHSTSNVAALPTVAEEEATEASKPAALAPISKLRMPSKHTPGKLQTTAPAPTRGRRGTKHQNVLQELPPTALAGTTQQEQEEVVVSPPGVGNEELNAILASQEDTPPPPQQLQQVVHHHSWFQVVTTALNALVLTVTEVLTSLVVPQVEQFAEEPEEEVPVNVTKPLLTRGYVWFILFFFLQFLCLEPIVTTVEEASNRSLDFLQGMFAADEIPGEEPTVVLPSSKDERVQELESLSTLLESMQHSSKLTEEMEFAQRKLLEIRGRLTEKATAIDDWQSGLNDVELALANLIATDDTMQDVPRLFFNANEILGFFKDMVPPTLSAELLDPTYIFMWETASSTSCRQPKQDSNDDDPILTKVMWQMGQDELRQMMLLSATEIMSSEDVSRNLQVWVREALPEHDTSRAQQEKETPTNGLTQDVARGVIRQLLEKERADQLGVVDYASILAGASVIERATTPSLVDSLPLLNRLMKQARLRFYGYGPEAALTPTFPVNALGQCWAFERHSKRKGGRYATLTVQLGQPVYVTKIVVEHAPKELTNEPETAIQQFRILGYEDRDATDKPWNLGSFQYDIDAPRVLQQFQVANHVNSELIPKLQSIALAIDSNWGSNYSCLYRFRVLGSEEPSEDVIEADIADDYDDDFDVDSDIVDSIDDAQETKEDVEVKDESEDLDAEPDASRDEEHADDFVEDEEAERVSDDDTVEAEGSEPDEREEIASEHDTETNVADERKSDDENEEETSESTIHDENGDNTNDSESTTVEDSSGTEDALHSEDGTHVELETEDSRHVNVDDNEQMVNSVDHDINEDTIETNGNDEEDVDDAEIHNWDNPDRDSGDDSGEHDSGDSASGDNVHSQEQDSEDDSGDDSEDDSSDAEEHDSGDDSRDEHESGDDEGEDFHDEH